MLEKEEYGLHTLEVREIIGVMNITAIPNMPDYVRGVVNLRGATTPIVDLRLKFGMGRAQDTEETCIIVVELSNTPVGLIVDKVSEVLDIEDSDIDQVPSFGASLDTSFIQGIGKLKYRVILLLNIANVLGSELAKLHELGSKEHTMT